MHMPQCDAARRRRAWARPCAACHTALTVASAVWAHRSIYNQAKRRASFSGIRFILHTRYCTLIIKTHVDCVYTRTVCIRRLPRRRRWSGAFPDLETQAQARFARQQTPHVTRQVLFV